VAVVGICYEVGGGVVSLRRVHGYKDTRILSPILELTSGAGASRFGAAPAELLSPFAFHHRRISSGILAMSSLGA
jgi:hypothetical protein